MLHLFEIDELYLNGEVTLSSGNDNPSIVGKSAPRGSEYLRTNGETWKKIGEGNLDWICLAFEGSGGGGGLEQIPLRTIETSKDILVAYDVGVVVCTHHYEDGIEVTFDAPNYYTHPITVKNLSCCPVLIKPRFSNCMIDGKKSYPIINRLSSVTLAPFGSDFIITSEVKGTKMVAIDCNS